MFGKPSHTYIQMYPLYPMYMGIITKINVYLVFMLEHVVHVKHGLHLAVYEGIPSVQNYLLHFIVIYLCSSYNFTYLVFRL